MNRVGRVERITKETKILVEIDLDGTGTTDIATGVPFFDHMLDALGKHGAFDLTVRAAGDIDIDSHHTVEDVAIVLGEAMRQALGDKKGIRRFGDAMDPDGRGAGARRRRRVRPALHRAHRRARRDAGLRDRRALPDGAQPARLRVAGLPRAPRVARAGSWTGGTRTTSPRPSSRRSPARCGRRWSRTTGSPGSRRRRARCSPLSPLPIRIALTAIGRHPYLTGWSAILMVRPARRRRRGRVTGVGEEAPWPT